MDLDLNSKINSKNKHKIFLNMNNKIDSFFNDEPSNNNKDFDISKKITKNNNKIKCLNTINNTYFTNYSLIKPSYTNDKGNIINFLDKDSKLYSLYSKNMQSFNKSSNINKSCNFKRDINKYYDIIKTLGTGSYAVVKEAKNKNNNKNYAIKIYQKNKIKNSSNKQMIFNEINILKLIEYDGIIKYVDDFEDNENYYIVMTKGIGKTIDNYKSSIEYNELYIYKIFIQILNCVKYMHDNYIFHRDLKLENIMLNKRNNKITLLDLGFSIKQKKIEKIEKLCGTPYYISPEIFLKKEHYGGPVDCWALGVILFKLSTGDFPFNGKNIKEILSNIIKGKIDFSKVKNPELKDLIARILLIDPIKRYNINNILNHAWIKKFNN